MYFVTSFPVPYVTELLGLAYKPAKSKRPRKQGLA